MALGQIIYYEGSLVCSSSGYIAVWLDRMDRIGCNIFNLLFFLKNTYYPEVKYYFLLLLNHIKHNLQNVKRLLGCSL